MGDAIQGRALQRPESAHPLSPFMENEMDEQDVDQQINPDILRLTRIKSRQLAGRYGFASYDAEDIQQDLLLDYLKRAHSFNANRCNRKSFARLIICNRVSTLIEEQYAGCRDYRAPLVSIDQFGDAIHPQVSDPTGRLFAERLTLRLDIERTLTRLPSRLVSLCHLLMVCETISAAAAKAGISRATFYRQIHQVRAEFARAGLGETFVGASTTRSRQCVLAEIEA